MKKVELTEILFNQGKSGITDSHIIAAIANIPVNKTLEFLIQTDHKLSELARWVMKRWRKIERIGNTCTGYFL
ncbi:hypothetical protein [Lunatibacter salilacus]|uniref:hypothetical protein n=1 Tax=Lunatibacter salilacus TaxID=2483804 RepID=UPI00131E96A6|nr:hypothetical protein [Lunatibacter salilacus]